MDRSGVIAEMWTTGAHASHSIQDVTPSTYLNAGKMQRQAEALAQCHDSRHNAICRYKTLATHGTHLAFTAVGGLPMVAEEACLEQPLYQTYNTPLKREVEDETRSSEIQLGS